MPWRVEISHHVARDLSRFDTQTLDRVQGFLERLSRLDDPRSIGEALTGHRLWKYRVGDMRVIARLEDHVMRVFVVRVGNRREVYRTLRRYF